MLKWFNEHRMVLVGFMVLAPVPIAAYLINFGGHSFSSDPEDWAHFGTYMSGTVGVVALIATLDALMVTIKQQRELVGQQEKLIEQQDHQIKSAESHQRKVEAYSRADKMFPSLIGYVQGMLGKDLREYLDEYGYGDIEFFHIPTDIKVRDLFDSEQFPDNILDESNVFLGCVFLAVCTRIVRMVDFMGECVKDAPELLDFFYSEFYDDQEAIYCSMAAYRAYDNDRFIKIAEAMDMPRGYHGGELPNRVWQEIGERLFGE